MCREVCAESPHKLTISRLRGSALWQHTELPETPPECHFNAPVASDYDAHNSWKKTHFHSPFSVWPSLETLVLLIPDLRYSNLFQQPPTAASQNLCPNRAQNGFTFHPMQPTATSSVVVGDAKIRMFKTKYTKIVTWRGKLNNELVARYW